ncbi:MAG: hypothetical protein IT460_04490 [Planctomycetes bacterium]|nr:hypothetical protein [Planctomycetota bacterium]
MSLDDERVRFYLRHAEQIEAWAALRVDVAEAVHAWLARLAEPLEGIASEAGPDVRTFARTDDDTTYPKLFLRREHWPMKDGSPTVAIGLEWQRTKTTFRGGSLPYVGVRASKGEPVGAALRASEAFSQLRRARRDKSSDWWAAWAEVPCPDGFPDARDAARDALVSAIRSAWQAYAPLVDAALRGAPRG